MSQNQSHASIFSNVKNKLFFNDYQEIIINEMLKEVTTIFYLYHWPVLLVTIYWSYFWYEYREYFWIHGCVISKSDSIERTRSRRGPFRIHKLCSSISYPSRTSRPLLERHDWFSPYPTYASPLANEKSHLDVIRNSDPVITPSRLVHSFACCFSSGRAP